MIRKTLLSLAACLALAASYFAMPVAASGPAICDPQQSNLCTGLGLVFAFEDDSDRPRFDENKTVAFIEADGQDVARAVGKVDSYAASFTGTDGNYLKIPRAGGMMSGSTISMWIYPTSNSAEQVILSAHEAGKPAPYIGVVPSGAGVQVRYTIPYGDQRGMAVVTNSKVLTLNTWYLVTFGYGPNPAPDYSTTSLTGYIAYVQINDLPKQYVGLSYATTGYGNDLVLGQRYAAASGAATDLPFSGRVDQLTFAQRQWDLGDVSAMYNGGTGDAYPFDVVSQINLSTQLVDYWSFDEAGTYLNPVNPPVPFASAYHQTSGCKLGACVAPPNYTNVGTTSPHPTPFTGDFSVSLWMYPRAAENGAIVQGGSASLQFMVTYGSTNKLQFYVYQTTGSCATTQITASQDAWHHVVLTWDNSTRVCSIRLDDASTVTGTGGAYSLYVPSASQYLLGTTNASNNAPVFDEVGRWSRKLSAAEITALYNSGSGRAYPF